MKIGHWNQEVVKISKDETNRFFTQSGKTYEVKEYQATGHFGSGFAEFKVRTTDGQELETYVQYPQQAPKLHGKQKAGD